ncbi:recombinase family protein [Streptomyces axinellae]
MLLVPMECLAANIGVGHVDVDECFPRAVGERPIRIGYARTSTARLELASQLEALHRAQCHKDFKEQISTRVKVRPELEKALALAHQFKEAAPETPVIFTVHELKRPARNAAELMTLSAELQAGGIQLELLTGPLTGIYDPNGMGAMFFAVLAVAGRSSATTSGRRPSKARSPRRPKATTADGRRSSTTTCSPRRRTQGQGPARPGDRVKLIIKTGRNAGMSPSVASLYRALAEAENATADDSLPLRPKPVRLRRPEDPLTSEELDLRERLQAQPRPNAETGSQTP